jgi:phosphopantetheinyl transferase (holo-ACP synthase)
LEKNFKTLNAERLTLNAKYTIKEALRQAFCVRLRKLVIKNKCLYLKGNQKPE